MDHGDTVLAEAVDTFVEHPLSREVFGPLPDAFAQYKRD